MAKEIEIDGVISDPNGFDIDYDKFYDAFIAFIEDRGLRFSGGVNELEDDTGE